MIGRFVAISAVPVWLAACTCSSTDVCRQVANTAVIFVGRVEEVRFSKKTFAPGDHVERRHHTFSVSEKLRGEVGSSVVVTTNANFEECGTVFEKGVEYVVLADRFNDGLVSSLCSGSLQRRFANSTLRYLRTVAGSPSPPSYLFGSVSNFKNDLPSIGGLDAMWPAANARVRVASGGVITEMRTGTDGSYAFTGLPSGTYRVEVSGPGRFDALSERPIELSDRGCAALSFYRADQASVEVRFAPGVRQGGGAKVTLEPAGLDMSRWGEWRPPILVSEPKKGLAVFSVPPGAYRIAWRPASDQAPILHRAPVDLEPGAKASVDFVQAEP